MRRAHALALAVAMAACAYDPLVTAEACKRPAALLLAVVALSLAMPLWGRRGRVALTPASTMWLLACGWACCSLGWGEHADLRALGPWFAAAGVALATGQLDVAEAREAATWTATLASGATALATTAQWLGGARGMALHGLMGNPNWQGLLLAAALPLQLALARRRLERETRLGWLLAATSGLSAVALLLSGSRVSWVALAVAALVAGGRRLRWLGGGALGLAAGFLALGGGAAAHALGGRWWIWRASLRAAAHTLPLGTGMGGFGFAYLDAQGSLLSALPLRAAALRFDNATSAHDSYLQALVVLGPLGLGLLATALLATVVGAWRRWPAGAAAGVAIAVCALGDAALESTPVVLLLGLLMAGSPRLARRKLDRYSTVAALACTAVLLPSALRGWWGARALGASDRGDPVTQQAAIEHAAHLDPRSGEIALAVGLGRLTLADARGAVTALERSRGLLANIGTDEALAQAHLRLGQTSEAVTDLRRALSRHPAMFRARLALAETLRRRGQLDAALRQLEQARALQPYHPKLLRLREQLRRNRIDAATR